VYAHDLAPLFWIDAVTGHERAAAAWRRLLVPFDETDLWSDGRVASVLPDWAMVGPILHQTLRGAGFFWSARLADAHFPARPCAPLDVLIT